MKKKIPLILLMVMLFTAGCTVKYNETDPEGEKIPPIETVMNYKGSGVVVDKACVDSLYFYILIRYFHKRDNAYYLHNTRVPKYEYGQYNLGDTIR